MDDDILGFEASLSGNVIYGDDRFFQPRLRCADLPGQAAFVDGEAERLRDVELTGELLGEDERPGGQLWCSSLSIKGIS